MFGYPEGSKTSNIMTATYTCTILCVWIPEGSKTSNIMRNKDLAILEAVTADMINHVSSIKICFYDDLPS